MIHEALVSLLQNWSGFWWLQGPRSSPWCYCEPAQEPGPWLDPAGPSYSHSRGPGPAERHSRSVLLNPEDTGVSRVTRKARLLDCNTWSSSNHPIYIYIYFSVLHFIHGGIKKVFKTKLNWEITHKITKMPSEYWTPILMKIYHFTCIGWYPPTEDTNITFPPLKEKFRTIENTTKNFPVGSSSPPSSILTLSSPYEAPPASSGGRQLLHLQTESKKKQEWHKYMLLFFYRFGRKKWETEVFVYLEMWYVAKASVPLNLFDIRPH